MKKEEFELKVKKYSIDYDKYSDTYSKSIFITNTDSDSLTLEYMRNDSDIDKCMTCTFIKDNFVKEICDGDIIEVKLSVQEGHIGKFMLTNQREEFVGTVILGHYDPDEYRMYDDIKLSAIDIAYVIKDLGVRNVNIHYRMVLTEKECASYIKAYDMFKDDEKAFRYFYDPEYIIDETEEFVECDTLLLYSATDLKCISERFHLFNEILNTHDLNIKGVFYSRCGFEAEGSYDPIYDNRLYHDRAVEKALYINIGTSSDFNFFDNVEKAVLQVYKVFGALPKVFSGSHLTSQNTNEKLNEDEYGFIKGFDKSKLVISDVHNHPDRYPGNFLENVRDFDRCDYYNFGLYTFIYTYKLSDNAFNVYIEGYSFNDERQRTLSRFTVDLDDFTTEELNLILAMRGSSYLEEDEHFDTETLREHCLKKEYYEEFKSNLAGFVAVQAASTNLMGIFEDDTDEEVAIKEKVMRVVKKKDIFDYIANEKEAEILSVSYERLKYTAKQIVTLEVSE